MGRKSNKQKYSEAIDEIYRYVMVFEFWRSKNESRKKKLLERLERQEKCNDRLAVELTRQDIAQCDGSYKESEAQFFGDVLEVVQMIRDDLKYPELANAWEAMGTRVFIENVIRPGLAGMPEREAVA